METFIFNLNKKQKYQKLKFDYSLCCNSSIGPFTADFGFNNNSMKSIRYYSNIIDRYYVRGSEILPSNYHTNIYDLLESEVYKIIIE